MSTTDQQIAETILQQLGGARFRIMTGAKNFLSGDRALHFQLPKCKQGINKMIITLESDDTYAVKAYAFNRKTFACPEVASADMLHAESLREVFTSLTGLDTSLGTAGR